MDCEICQKPFPNTHLPQCNHYIHSECMARMINSDPDSDKLFTDPMNRLVKCSLRCIGNINSHDFFKKVLGFKFFQEKMHELDMRVIQEMEKQDKIVVRGIEENVKFTCGICICEESVQEKGITLDCEHIFCRDCIQGVIQSKIQNGEFGEDKLICPHQECLKKVPINIHTIKYVCGQEAYDKVLQQRINHMKEFGQEVHVKCPTCDASYSVSKELMTTFLMCKFCSNEFCPNGCQKPHKGMTCKQFQAKMGPVGGFMKCPKCQIPILKEEGCNHISCKCGHEFCWLCGGPYKPKKLCTCKKNGIVDKFFGIFGFN